MQTLEEKLTASVRKYFLEPNPIEDGNRVRAVVQDAMRLCAKELGYESMEDARRALLPPRESTAAFVARVTREDNERRQR
jgi:hypothetical protein